MVINPGNFSRTDLKMNNRLHERTKRKKYAAVVVIEGVAVNEVLLILIAVCVHDRCHNEAVIEMKDHHIYKKARPQIARSSTLSFERVLNGS